MKFRKKGGEATPPLLLTPVSNILSSVLSIVRQDSILGEMKRQFNRLALKHALRLPTAPNNWEVL